MTRGLSTEQLLLIAVYVLSLGVTLIAVLLGAWRTAAAAGVVTFGLFSAVVILTLAARTYAASLVRDRVERIYQDLRTARTSSRLRHLDQRYSQMAKSVDATHARVEAAERRLTAAFDAHRLHLEEDLALRGEGTCRCATTPDSTQ